MADDTANQEMNNLQFPTRKQSARGSIQPVVRIRRAQLPASLSMRMNSPAQNSKIIAAAQQIQKRKSVIWDNSDASHKDDDTFMYPAHSACDWKAKIGEKLLEVRLRLGFVGSKLYTGEVRVKLSLQDLLMGEDFAKSCMSVFESELKTLGVQDEAYVWGWRLQVLRLPSKYTLDYEIETTDNHFVAHPANIVTWFQASCNHPVGPGLRNDWIPGITLMVSGAKYNEIINSAYRTKTERKLINQDLEKMIKQTPYARLIVNDSVLRNVDINTDGNRDIKDLRMKCLEKYETRQAGMDIKMEELRKLERHQAIAATQQARWLRAQGVVFWNEQEMAGFMAT